MLAELPEGIDGMMFVFIQPRVPTFIMRDTVIPLDLWYFDPTGSLMLTW